VKDQPTRFTTLPNGLDVLLRETHSAPVAEIQIWCKVGSADEAPGEEGLAHFHEHMLFKGTERRGLGEIAGEVEGVGGRINAYTSFDQTVYYATLPSAEVGTGIDVLADALQHSIFDPDEVSREVEVVLEEIRRSKDTPGDVLGDVLFRTAYTAHPYRVPILGPAENVASFTREKVSRFFKRWYAPDNLLVVGVGDFDSDSVLEQIQAALGDAQPSGITRPPRRIEPGQSLLRSSVLSRPFECGHLEFVYPATGFSHPDTPLLDLLAFVLGEGDSSRLTQDLKERDALVDGIHASCFTPLDPGVFGVSALFEPPRVNEVIHAITKEIQRLRFEPVSREELEKARINFLSSEYFERESVSGIAHKLGNFQAISGDYRDEERYLESIREATPEALFDVAQRYFTPEKLNIAVVGPEAEEATGAERIAEAVHKACSEVDGAYAGLPQVTNTDDAKKVSSPAPPSSRPAMHAKRNELHRYELSNGSRLFVAPQHDTRVVAVRSAVVGGLLAEADASTQAGLSHFLTGLWVRGTENDSAADFARKTEGLAAEIDGFTGRSTSGLTLDVHTDCLEPALELYTEALVAPAFDDIEIERERRDVLAAIARREDNLGAMCFNLFLRTLFDTHPYGHPVGGETDCVLKFTRETVKNHYEQLVRGPGGIIGVAGDVDPENIAALLSDRLARLSPAEAVPFAPEIDPLLDGIREVHLSKDRAQTHLVLGMNGLSVNDPDRFALDVISQVLAGQSGRLFLELRDKQSLAYALSTSSAEGIAPGFFAVYIATAPEKATQAKEGILIELDRLLQSPPGPEELEHAKRNLTGNFSIDQQRAANRAAHITHDALYGLGADASQHYAADIDAVTAEDVLRVARRILRLDAYVLAQVQP
jgi:zinc protease